MKLKKVILVFLLTVLVVIQSPGVVLAAAVSVIGRAKVENTGNSYLDFTGYDSNVMLDDTTGIFSGYAWLEDVGWVAFGTTDNSLGPVDLDLSTGRVSGRAKSLNTDVYLDFTDYNSNVTFGLGGSIFSGFVFAEDVGWIDFSDTGVTTGAAIADTFDLDGPGQNSYTNSNRPTFKWRGARDSSSLSKYSFEVDNGDSGDFSVDQIAVSGTQVNSQDRYVINWENFSDADNTNNFVSIYTKSSTVWNADNNDGKLKEGKRSWTVKAYGSAGSTRSRMRTLFVDWTGPTIELTQVNSAVVADNLATLDTTPTIFGKLIDPLAGDKTENRVAAGPKNVEIRIEKRNLAGSYTLHSLATVNLTESYWSDNGEKINDNSQNRADKYSSFSFTPSEVLGSGWYRVVVKGRDGAGNESGEKTFTLSVKSAGDFEALVEETGISEVRADDSGQASPEAERVISVPAEEESRANDAVGSVASLGGRVYWGVVDGVVGVVGAVSKVVGWVGGGVRTVASWVGRSVGGAGGFVGGVVDASAAKLPRPMAGVMLGLKNGVGVVGSGVGRVAQVVGGGVGAVAGKVLGPVGGFLGKQQVKLIAIGEILFDRQPTTIRNVRVAERGRDYAVIAWETNHLTTSNKINYGKDLLYGQDVIELERSRSHELRIENLEPGTKYYFEVMSKNKNYVYDAYHEFETYAAGDETPGGERAGGGENKVLGVTDKDTSGQNKSLGLVVLGVMAVLGIVGYNVKRKRKTKVTEMGSEIEAILKKAMGGVNKKKENKEGNDG